VDAIASSVSFPKDNLLTTICCLDGVTFDHKLFVQLRGQSCFPFCSERCHCSADFYPAIVLGGKFAASKHCKLLMGSSLNLL